MWAPAEEEATAWWKSRRLINKSGGGRRCLWPVFNYKDVCMLCLMMYGPPRVRARNGRRWLFLTVPAMYVGLGRAGCWEGSGGGWKCGRLAA